MSEAIPSDLLRVMKQKANPAGIVSLADVRNSFGPATKTAQFDAMLETLVKRGFVRVESSHIAHIVVPKKNEFATGGEKV